MERQQVGREGGVVVGWWAYQPLPKGGWWVVVVGLLARRSGLGGLGEDTAPASTIMPPLTDSRQSSSQLPQVRSHSPPSPPSTFS